MEICYIFKLRMEAEGSRCTLFKRHLLQNERLKICNLCDLEVEESVEHIFNDCAAYQQERYEL